MDKNKDTDFFETLKDKKGFMNHFRNSFNVFKKEKARTLLILEKGGYYEQGN